MPAPGLPAGRLIEPTPEPAMKKYVTTTIVTLPAGTVMELNAEQAAARRHALVTTGKGVYRAASAVQFKRGEVIGLDVEPPKALADELIDEKEAAKRNSTEKAKRDKAEAAALAQIVAAAEAKALADLLAKLPTELRAAVDKALAAPAPSPTSTAAYGAR